MKGAKRNESYRARLGSLHPLRDRRAKGRREVSAVVRHRVRGSDGVHGVPHGAYGLRQTPDARCGEMPYGWLQGVQAGSCSERES